MLKLEFHTVILQCPETKRFGERLCLVSSAYLQFFFGTRTEGFLHCIRVFVFLLRALKPKYDQQGQECGHTFSLQGEYSICSVVLASTTVARP